jgi:hypothetical protein
MGQICIGEAMVLLKNRVRSLNKRVSHKFERILLSHWFVLSVKEIRDSTRHVERSANVAGVYAPRIPNSM